MGFQIRTRNEGLYAVELSFVTDKIEGNYKRLEILVEHQPHTVMLCHAKEHGRHCSIDPSTPEQVTPTTTVLPSEGPARLSGKPFD
jgi:hypothetical protein